MEKLSVGMWIWVLLSETMACLRYESAGVLMLFGHHLSEGKPSLPISVGMWK
ncbi:MAG: hypothetical protein WC656_10615 [Sulfurimonas sp.]